MNRDLIVSKLIELTISGTIKWARLYINLNTGCYSVDYRGILFRVSDFYNNGENSLSIIVLDVFSEHTQNSTSFSSKKVNELKIVIDNSNPPRGEFTSTRSGDEEILLKRVLKRLS